MSEAPTIAVLGEALLDVFPEREVIGGAPFNVARNLAALGGRALMITRIGEDARGARIAAEFERFGLDPSGLQRDPARPTGTVEVSLQADGGHRFDIAEDQAWDRLDAAALVQALRAARPAIVYFGSLAQRDAISREAIRAGLAATPAPRFLDLNLRDGPQDNERLAAESLRLAQIVKINDDELERLREWFVAAAAPGLEAAVEALARRFELRRVVVTRGAAGYACFDAPARRWLHGAAPPVDLRDTVGAGDAFASVLLLGEVKGWPLAHTLERAAAFASAVCTIRGAVEREAAIYAAALARWAAQGD